MERLYRSGTKNNNKTSQLFRNCSKQRKHAPLYLKFSSIHIQKDTKQPRYKVYGAKMGPTLVLLAPGGPHLAPCTAIKEATPSGTMLQSVTHKMGTRFCRFLSSYIKAHYIYVIFTHINILLGIVSIPLAQSYLCLDVPGNIEFMLANMDKDKIGLFLTTITKQYAKHVHNYVYVLNTTRSHSLWSEEVIFLKIKIMIYMYNKWPIIIFKESMSWYIKCVIIRTWKTQIWVTLLLSNIDKMGHRDALFAQITVAPNTNTKLTKLHKWNVDIIVSSTPETCQ